MGQETAEFEALYEKTLQDMNDSFPLVAGGREVISCKGSANKRVYVLRDDKGVKTILKQYIITESERLLCESEILKNARHPGIPMALEYREEGGWAYLLREYVEGMNLEELVSLRGCLSQREIIDIGVQLCDILTFLHTRDPQIIHRDVKPQNIIFTPDKKVMLIDFDIARTYDESARTDTVYLGTRTTAPPEQFGYGQTDARSDIYSLGVVLIYLSTGDYDVKKLDSMPKAFARVCRRCTDFSPENRYESALLLKRQLQKLKNGTVKKVMLGVGAAVLMGLLVALGALLGRGALKAKPAAEQAAVQQPAAALQTPTAQQAASEVLPGDTELPEWTGEFAVPEIEAYVRQQLAIPEGEPVLETDLLRINSLHIYGTNVYSRVQSVEYGRDGAYLNGQELLPGVLTDLSDIARMQNLRELTLQDQNIKDVSLLSGLTELESLSLKDNPVEDISVLSGMKYLEMISLCNTRVTDLSPLSGCKYLKDLDLNGLRCESYSAVAGQEEYRFLDISGADANEAVRCFSGKRVETMKLNYSELTDLSPFLSLVGLRELHADNNEKITSLSGIENLQQLELVSLQMDYGITDLTPLLQLPALKQLIISSDMQQLTAPLSGAAFEIIYKD